ncbi:DUF6898 family protein [Methylobrevis pamukkalensis]|uniref:DUF6898 domain-containing protein n=1 Tax=Methylobrevis pamukkalensis TaxID=1439726 RepID=A0A1E3GZ27_9HYPH|nr:hypothetical protein A6302_03892 [Methylobrevis pamukkalensis]
MTGSGGGTVYFEFQIIGRQMRATAIDAATGVEAL